MLGLLAGAAVRSLFLAAAVTMGLLPRRTRSPHVSLAAWTLVLAASLLMPAAMKLTSIALPHSIVTVWQLPVAPEPLAWIEASLVTSRGEPGLPATASAAGEIALYLYLAVFSALMLRLLAGLSLSWRIARAATPIAEEWAGGFDVRASRRISAPATFGSIILLPDDHAGWRPAKRSAVLAHEAAHVARRDFAIQLAAAVNRAVFWFNPLSWWLQRHLSDLAEAASDDVAIAHLNDRLGYAEILLEISGRVSRLPSTVSMARRAAVGSRIERILSEPPLPLGMNRRSRATLAACIVPLAVSLSFLTILPAPPPRLPLSAWAPPSAEIVAEEGANEDVRPPKAAPAIVAGAIPPQTLTSTDATIALIAPTVPPPAGNPRMEVASLPPPPSKLPPPPRPPAAARKMPQPAPHFMTRNTLVATLSRAMRPSSPTAKRLTALDRPSGSDAVNTVERASYSTTAPPPTTGTTSEEGQSPVFAKLVNETCMGVTYLDGASATLRRYNPVQARFYRGPGDTPWVTFSFATQKPTDLPVTIRGSEIKFTTTFGMIYTLFPSSNMLLPPQYHRLTGSAEHPLTGTVQVACGKLSHPL